MKNRNAKRILSNHIFMLRIIYKSCKWFIPFMIFLSIMRGINTFLATTYLYQYVINSLQQKFEIKTILIHIALIFAFMFFYNILLQFKNAQKEIVLLKIEKEFQKQLLKKASKIDIECYETPNFYNTYIKATSDNSKRAIKILDNFCDLIVVVITAGSILTLIFSINPIFVALAIIPAVVTFFLTGKQNVVQYEKDMKSKEIAREKDYVGRVFYLKNYAKELRLTKMYQVMFQRLKTSIHNLKFVSKQYGYKLMFISSCIAILFEIVVYFGALGLASYKTLVQSTMLLGDCFVVINSIMHISYMVGELGDIVAEFGSNSLYVENFRTFLNYPCKITENENGHKADTFKTLTVDHLSFSYNGQKDYALQDVSMKIEKGQKIAIVGENGSGKTTLIKILLRLYDPTLGQVIYNGIPINEYNLLSYRKVYSTAFQDYQVFSTSVAENVMLKGNLNEEDKKKAENALKMVDLYNKISENPKGIDCTVTKEFDQNGLIFSGGEAQKLAISRIIAGSSQIVILDEPSSALDPIAENKMFNNVLSACKEKTIIFISHRLSSVTMADKIYLLDKGSIIEEGTHQELLSLQGKYSEMFHKQAEEYRKGVTYTYE